MKHLFQIVFGWFLFEYILYTSCVRGSSQMSVYVNPSTFGKQVTWGCYLIGCFRISLGWSFLHPKNAHFYWSPINTWDSATSSVRCVKADFQYFRALSYLVFVMHPLISTALVHNLSCKVMYFMVYLRSSSVNIAA